MPHEQTPQCTADGQSMIEDDHNNKTISSNNNDNNNNNSSSSSSSSSSNNNNSNSNAHGRKRTEQQQRKQQHNAGTTTNTMASNGRDLSIAKLPMAVVSLDLGSRGVSLDLGQGGGKTIAGIDAPSNGTFTVTQTDGSVPWRQTFGTILSNHGGTLDIKSASGTTRYRIEVTQQANDRKWTTEYAHTLPVRLQPASVDPKSEPGKLLGRSGACQEIMTVAVNNCTQRNTTDHAEFSFLVASGHVRSGKTRMGIEAPRLVEHACKTNNNVSGLKILKPVYLKMDFLNGCKFDVSFDLDASPSVALGARLMYAFHGTPPDLELKGVSLKSITHHDAFRYIISRTIQSDKSGEGIVPLVCHFDEHGNFTDQFGKAAKDESAGRTQFINMLWLIGSTVTSTDSPLRADLQGRYFVVPITTGTSKKEANISGISRYGLNQLPLPSLSFEDSIELARQFFVIAAPGAGARIDAELKKLPLRIAIADTGGLPGLVGMVARGGLLDSGEYTVRLHGNVAGYTHGLDWSAHWSKLVSVCLARPTVNEETIIEKNLKRTPNGTVEELYKVSDARDSGTILFENNEIGLSVSLVRRFNTQANNRQSVNEVLLRDMTNSMTWGWEIFEQAHAHYLAAVMAALIETKDEFFGGSVTLGNLLRHANPTGNVYLQRTLQLPLSFDGVNVKKEVKQSIPRGTGKRKRHTVDLDTKQEVMLAADGTPIIDGHMNLTLGNAGDATGDGAVTLFMQYKHKKLESKTQVKVSEMNAAVQLLESRLKTSKWQGGEWLFLWVSNRQVVVDMENTDHRLLWVGKDDLVKHAPLIGRRGLVLEETDRADED